MSANVKIGNDVIENAHAIRLEDADYAGRYIVFSQNQIPEVKIRRTNARSSSLPSYQASEWVPTTEDTVLSAQAVIRVPLDETIIDISYVAGIEGGLYLLSRASDNFFISPNSNWGWDGDGSSSPQVTVTQTQGEDGTYVAVRFTTEGSSMWRTAFANGLDRGSMRAVVFLIVTSV